MARRTSKWRTLLVAAAIAVAPIVGLNLLLWFQINTHGRDNIKDAASGMLALVEARLDDTGTQLVILAMKNVESCDGEGLAALQKAMLQSPASEMSMVDKSGRAQCSASDEPRTLRVVSPQNDTANAQIKLATVDFGNDNGPRLVRLQYQTEGGGYAALLPGNELMPAVLIGRLQADFVARLTLLDGTFIATRLSRPNMDIQGDTPAFRARTISERYPLAVTVEVPTSALWSSYRELFLWGNAGGAVLAFLTISGALAVSRQSEGPARDIDRAIRRGDFIPYYQPVINLRTGRIIGCEVLVRRRRPDGGVDAPGRFIHLVEATGQIFEITRAVMAGARDEMGPVYGPRPHLKASFNLVAGHFENLEIVDDVTEIFGAESQLRLSQVVVEVTERQPLPNLARARVVITRLQELGIRVALDDVGTGHGGLSYLLKLGIDQMKIDKMFIDAIGTDRYSATIVDTLVNLARDLSMDLIAEGVETMEQVEYLRRIGVEGAQGYVFAPPLPGAMFKALVEASDPLGEQASTMRERSPGAVRA